MASGLSKNDPYNKMERSDIAPKSFSGNNKSENGPNNDNGGVGGNGAAGTDKSQTANAQDNNLNDPKSQTAQNRENAENNLSNAEQNAQNAQYNNPNEELRDLVVGEEDPKEFISKVGEKLAKRSALGRLAISKLRGKGPVATIIMVMLIIGGLMFASQGAMPFSVVEQLKEKYDGLNISNTVRSNKIFNMQLQRKGIKTATKANGLFGINGNTYNLTKKQQAHLANQGITMHEVEIDGQKKNILLFDNGSEGLHVVVADQGDVDLIHKKFGNGLSDIEINGKRLKLDTSDTMTFKNRYAMDLDFHNGYTAESLTWRGSISQWFDSKAVHFLDQFGVTRKIFGNYIAKVKGIEEGNKATRQRVIDAIKNGTNSDSTIKRVRDEKYQGKDDIPPETDADGNIIKEGETVPDNRGALEGEPDDGFVKKANGDIDHIDQENTSGLAGSTSTNGMTLSAAQQKAQKVADFVNSRGMKTLSSGATYLCTALRVVNIATVISAAQEMMQLVKVATSALEATDKARTPDSDGSPVHTFADGMVEEVDTVIYDDEGRHVIRRSTGMQSSSAQAMYTDKKIDPNDPSVASFSLGEVFKSVIQKVAGSDAAFYGCSVANIFVNTVQMVGTIAACVVSFGMGCLFGSLTQQIASTAIQLTISTVIVPMITKALINKYARDLIGDLAGENWFNALVSGSHIFMAGNFKNGGGSLGTYDAFLAYRTEQQAVLADRAIYERTRRSPFDASSQYTFLGSIVKQIIALSTVSKAPTSFFSGITSMVGSSVLALIPSASAADEIANDMIPVDEFNQQCPYLASINAYGDAFCNPYIITDSTTMDMQPDEVETVVSDQLDSDGKIKQGSDLAKYVLYCSERNSPFGVEDQNIADNISQVTPADSVLGQVPIIGDVVSIINEEEKLRNMGWISGESCVAGNTIGDGWSETRNYQRYVEDQRLYEAMSDDYTSTVTEFLSEYYEENPIDESYEGTLARLTGYNKEDITYTLAWMDYQRYIADYDPSERYAFGEGFDMKKAPMVIENDNEQDVAILQHDIIYADVRNRAFAMA